jgi:branched-chain amino acid transport system substrate-binding protein
VVTAKIGFLAPLTGPVAGWGLPGLNGNEIWVEHFNAQGGITLSDGTQVLIELVPYDNEYITEKALTGAKKLVLEDEVVLVQMLGGATAAAAVPFMTDRFMVSTTLLTSDLTPSTLYHLAPIEVHPFYNITGIEWLAINEPEIRTMAITSQDDELGRPGVAAKVAAAEAAGIEVVYEELFDIETTDFAPVVSEMMATNPDMMSWDTAYPDYVNLLTQQAYQQGYTGRLESCTLDFYDAIIEKTSVEFMEGFIWQFPDFDDPMLNPNPNPYGLMKNVDFWDEYNEKYPGTWSAVSYEYMAILDEWMQAVKAADSIDPMLVFAAWRHPEENNIYHVFGEGTWWGKPFWGIDNAFMTTWPVVQMQNGKARIVEFRDQLDWWERNKAEMVAVNERYGEMWWQRMGVDRESGIKLWGLEEEYQFLLEE